MSGLLLDLNLVSAPKTPKGALSVSRAMLDYLEKTAPEGHLARRLVQIKREHSKGYKLLTTYSSSLLKQLPYRADGRIRCDVHHTGTDTGRFSCSDPNLQAQPRDEEGWPSIRKMFVAGSDRLVLDADYAQLEVIILAHYSRDPALLDVVLNGKSMHDITAAALGIPRHTAKVVNFLKSYGGGAKKLATALGIPLVNRYGKLAAPRHVQEYCDKWDRTYEGVTEYRSEMAKFARTHGYVQTLLGRRRYLPEIHSSDKIARFHAERVASNTPIQGTAADIVKTATVNLHKHWRGTDKKILLQVHDELVSEVPETGVEEAAREKKEIMESAVKLTLPLKAEVKWAKSWAEAK